MTIHLRGFETETSPGIVGFGLGAVATHRAEGALLAPWRARRRAASQSNEPANEASLLEPRPCVARSGTIAHEAVVLGAAGIEAGGLGGALFGAGVAGGAAGKDALRTASSALAPSP
jgi:hypothetical protein